MKSLIDIEQTAFRKSAIFQIPLASEKHVFMRVDQSNYNNDKRCVVLVSAKAFLAAWARDPYNFEAQLSRGSKQAWITDYKYPHAETGFSQGRQNPVPLAEVVCRQHEGFTPVYSPFLIFFKRRVGYRENQFTYTSFTNGITRTIWRLANDAEYFPIECDYGEGAKLLHQDCGYGSQDIYTVEQLIK